MSISKKEVKDILRLKENVIQPEQSWELWYPKENIVSITYQLIEEQKIPATFAEDAKKYFESVIVMAIKHNVLELLFDRVSYLEILSGEYSFTYKIDPNQKVTIITAKK